MNPKRFTKGRISSTRLVLNELLLTCSNRYYHLFAKGELDDLIVESGLADIKSSGYDRDNHYVIAIKK